MKYEIIYDYCSDDGYEEHNIKENFCGGWNELQKYLKDMRSNGCYNIDATCIDEEIDLEALSPIDKFDFEY